jgi:hypothetical protein
MRRRAIGSLVVALALISCVSTVFTEDVAPQHDPADDVLSMLKRTLGWYQQARIAMQSANEAAGGLIMREDEQALLRVVQRAFDVAKAKAALLVRSGTTAPTASSPETERVERRAKLEAAVRDDEREVARLRKLARSAPRARRAALERELVVASRRLELDRLRLEFVTSLEQADASLASGDLDLAHQIQALQDAVPELNPGNTPAKTVVATPPPPATGTWPVVHRLLALQRSRNSLEQLAVKTNGLARDVDEDLTKTQATVRGLAERLRALASNAGTGDATAPPPDDQDFHAQLDRVKALAAVVLPLRAEAALLHRFVGDVQGWERTLERETRHVLEELGLELVGVAVALLVILIGAILWRVATVRYVTDPYRRRLSITARNVVVGIAVVLVIVFRFTTELTALVTALGFAAAGIAFALQNVILAVAGYFSMVAPNGIRVGDRVSLQGPFGYVHGEVLEIGFVRVRLRELSSDGLEPTGRIVVFPNSVVFTGSFFKLPPPPQVKVA